MRVKLIAFAKEIYQTWISERPSQLGAGLAYYAMFSSAPVIYIAISVAGIFLDKLALSEMLFVRVAQVMGVDTAILLQEMIETIAIDSSSNSILTTLIGFAALLIAASSVFFYLQYALNTIWRVPPPSRGATKSFLQGRIITFLLAISVGLLLVVSSAANIILSIIQNFFDVGGWGVANFGTTIALGTLAFAVIYKILPNAQIAWRDVWVGALVTSLLITLGGWGLGIYLANSSITSAFEAAGTLAVFLISVFFFAQLFLFGAVFTRVYASMFGSKSRAPILDQSNHLDSIVNRE